MNIRKGEKYDMPAVLDLIRELAAFEKEPDAVVITADDLVRDGFGDHPLFNVLVAETADGIAGMALFYNRYSTWKGKTIHLEDLVVRESMRGRGIGMELYTAVMEEAKKQNVRRVEWNVLDWNVDAIRFYERTGAVILDDWRTVQMSEDAIGRFAEKFI